MPRSLFSRLFIRPVLIFSLGFAVASSAAALDFPWKKQNETLVAFTSEAELNAWLLDRKKRVDEHQKERRERAQKAAKTASVFPLGAAQPPSQPPGVAQAEMSAPSPAEPESVTNTQTTGVDEGSIVKVHNRHLVVLRRGRLFTIDIGNNRLSPVSVIDAYAPGSPPGHAWYDEMLISGNTIAVIGYSYRKGGTEVVLFNIDAGGKLSYRTTHILRSNDYYSSRNYASRLIGDKLIFYTPLYINFYAANPLDFFPAIRAWQDGKAGDFKRIAPATQIYRTDEDLDPTKTQIALHTIQICDLSRAEMSCTATAVLASAGREFYVSRDAVYVWTSPFARRLRAEGNAQPVSAALFRLPLDGKQAPTAIKTMGSPIDQFSFLESDDGYLNVLLRSEGPAASMWSSEGGSKDLALLRVAVSQFGNGTQSVPPDNYYPLPAPQGGHAIQSRYIGNYLLYGAGNTWGRSPSAENVAYALVWKKPQEAPARLTPSHSVDRIEALGRHALLVGTQDSNLVFTTIALSKADRAAHVNAISRFSLVNAAQGETRSHGFFYKPESEVKGILGLPFRGGSGSGGWNQLHKVSSGIVYVRNHNLSLSEMGILGASPNADRKDNCKASCVDWYGNSRPLFLKGRVFALMGYELVEGKVSDGQISEVRRIDFSPVVSQTPRQ